MSVESEPSSRVLTHVVMYVVSSTVIVASNEPFVFVVAIEVSSTMELKGLVSNDSESTVEVMASFEETIWTQLTSSRLQTIFTRDDVKAPSVSELSFEKSDLVEVITSLTFSDLTSSEVFGKVEEVKLDRVMMFEVEF